MFRLLCHWTTGVIKKLKLLILVLIQYSELTVSPESCWWESSSLPVECLCPGCHESGWGQLQSRRSWTFSGFQDLLWIHFTSLLFKRCFQFTWNLYVSSLRLLLPFILDLIRGQNYKLRVLIRHSFCKYWVCTVHTYTSWWTVQNTCSANEIVDILELTNETASV